MGNIIKTTKRNEISPSVKIEVDMAKIQKYVNPAPLNDMELEFAKHSLNMESIERKNRKEEELKALTEEAINNTKKYHKWAKDRIVDLELEANVQKKDSENFQKQTVDQVSAMRKIVSRQAITVETTAHELQHFKNRMTITSEQADEIILKLHGKAMELKNIGVFEGTRFDTDKKIKSLSTRNFLDYFKVTNIKNVLVADYKDAVIFAEHWYPNYVKDKKK